MKIFILCCLSLILFAADAADTDSDTEDFADELLEALVDKKSDTNDSTVDEDKREEQDLDLKIIKDILSGDKQSLQEDLQERQRDEDDDEGFPNFLTSVGLGTADILRVATSNVGGDVIELIDRETDDLTYRRKARYLCRLSRRVRPRWLRFLKDVFPEVDQYLDENCQG